MNTASMESLLRVLGEGAYAVDPDRRILHWNKAAEAMSGYLASEVVGSKCSDNILRHVTEDGKMLCTDGCPLQATMLDGLSREANVYMHHKDGHRVPVFVRSAPLLDEAGNIAGCLEIFSDRRDRTSLLAELEELRRENLSDSLTGLGNRRYLDLVAETRFAALREEGARFGLLIADIDHFKRVNDAHGHMAGDKILAMTAKTIQGAIRPLDSAARFGGEEFVVLCPGCGAAELGKIAERICNLIRSAWLNLGGDERLSVTVSVGGAVSTPKDDLAGLLARADGRMYQCKEAGRDRYLVGE